MKEVLSLVELRSTCLRYFAQTIQPRDYGKAIVLRLRDSAVTFVRILRISDKVTLKKAKSERNELMWERLPRKPTLISALST